MQELDAHDEVRRKFLKHQGEMKRLQLQRLDDEMKRKVRNEGMKECLPKSFFTLVWILL